MIVFDHAVLQLPVPDLGDNDAFENAWAALGQTLQKTPLFEKSVLSEFQKDGFVHLYDPSLARKISEETAFQETPEQRSVGNKHPPVNTIADYVLLAVVRQSVLHMPDHVCHIHSFSELYGGRIITDIIPEKQHVEFHGAHREVDHTKLEEKPMRLHVDDADHLLRAPIQLLFGIKNVMETTTTVALVPPDNELQKAGIQTELLRENRFRHIPPKLIDIAKKHGCHGSRSQKSLGRFARALAIWNARLGSILVIDNTRVMHGRGLLQPVPRSEDRRWVKRLWLSSTLAENDLSDCLPCEESHPRVFSRSKAYFKVHQHQPHPYSRPPSAWLHNARLPQQERYVEQAKQALQTAPAAKACIGGSGLGGLDSKISQVLSGHVN
eukprot:symbB.v1.2.011564.t1/scaffold715.1/size233058/10